MLRGAIEWSYRLLGADEQHVFRRFSIFAGECTLEALRAVSGIADQALFDIVSLLIDSSLVRRETRRDGPPRFRMLDTLRGYAVEQLAAHGETDAAGERHAVYFMEMIERAEPDLVGPAQAAWLDRLAPDLDNLRSALSWFKARGALDEAFRTASGWRYFWTRGLAGEGRRHLEGLLRAADPGGAEIPAGMRARALDAAGHLAMTQGDFLAARPLCEAALALHRETGNPQQVAQTLRVLSIVYRSQGELNRSRACLDEALAMYEATGDRVGVSLALLNLGTIAVHQGNYRQAQTYYNESLTIRREPGNWRTIGLLLNNLALLAYHLKENAQAERLARESIETFRNIGDKPGLALALFTLAGVRLDQADHDEAATLTEQSLTIFRDLDDRYGTALCVSRLGSIAFARGNGEQALSLLKEALHTLHERGILYDTARTLIELGRVYCACGQPKESARVFRTALALCRQHDYRQWMAEGLEGLADVLTREGSEADGLRLLGAASRIREETGTPALDQPVQERVVRTAREGLDEATARRAWMEGRTVPREQLMESVLGSGDMPVPSAKTVPPRLRIHMFGRFRAFVGSHLMSDEIWGRPGALHLLQYLILHGTRLVPAEELVEVFWPNASSVEQTSLYRTISRIRGGLSRCGLGPEALRHEHGGYRLVLPPDVWVDAQAFDEYLRAARSAQHLQQTTLHLEAALALYEGHLLADLPYEEWCALDRDGFRIRCVEACLLLASGREKAGQLDDAIGLYARGLELDPVLEEAHRGLMRCHAASGRRDYALRLYHACRRILQKELQIEPSTETDFLYRSIQRGALQGIALPAAAQTVTAVVL